MDALLQGPREPEHYSEIPPATRLRSINMKDGVAYVDLTDDFFASGGSTGSTLRLAQLVFTLTQFPSIRSVQVLDEGYKRDVLGGEGFPIAGPLSRDDFRNLA